MRRTSALSLLSAFALAACERRADDPRRADELQEATSLTRDEQRHRITSPGGLPATLRTGPEVPIALPHGFTLPAGAKVVSSTSVEHGGERRMLVVFEVADAPARVIGQYRDQVMAAGAQATLDLGGEDSASLGGTLADARSFAISARREGRVSRVEFAVG